MLNTADINLLKDVFVTKDELKKEAQSIRDLIDKRTESLALEFVGLITDIGEIKNELKEMNNRMDAVLSELQSNRIILGNHEDRMQQLEAA